MYLTNIQYLYMSPFQVYELPLNMILQYFLSTFVKFFSIDYNIAFFWSLEPFGRPKEEYHAKICDLCKKELHI